MAGGKVKGAKKEGDGNFEKGNTGREDRRENKRNEK